MPAQYFHHCNDPMVHTAYLSICQISFARCVSNKSEINQFAAKSRFFGVTLHKSVRFTFYYTIEAHVVLSISFNLKRGLLLLNFKWSNLTDSAASKRWLALRSSSFLSVGCHEKAKATLNLTASLTWSEWVDGKQATPRCAFS